MTGAESPARAVEQPKPRVLLTAYKEGKGRRSNPSPGGSRRQSQRRLRSAEIDELFVAYSAGELVKVIAARFAVSRTTVIGHVTRSGLPRRSDLRWSEPELQLAASLYADGYSLAVGARFDIHAETVRARLQRAGVQIRTRRGWT